MNIENDTSAFLTAMKDIEADVQKCQDAMAKEWGEIRNVLIILLQNPQLFKFFRDEIIVNAINKVDKATTMNVAQHDNIKSKLSSNALPLTLGMSKVVNCSNLAMLRSTSTSHKF